MTATSAALPVARAVLRLLVIANGLYGLGILALLVSLMVAEGWTLDALGARPDAASASLGLGFKAVAGLGLLTVPLHFAILQRLRAMVETVRSGDPFVAINATRLQAIAWALLALQVISLAIDGIARAVSTPAQPLHLDAGFSMSGWLAVLLTFVLAQVFAEGARLREDLAGTV